MNDFVAGFGAISNVQVAADRFFYELRGKHLDTEHSSVANAFVMNGPHQKVIDDILIEDNRSHSWMCLLGMPLIQEQTPETRRELLRDFFRNPSEVLRSRIDGHFVLFAFDDVENRFIASNDINSFIPVFYTKTEHAVLFSSSELVLARLLGRPIDSVGIAQSLFFSATWDSLSRFANINKLLPGEIVSVRKGNDIRKERYWHAADESVWTGGFDSALEKWMDLLRDSVLTFRHHAPDARVSADITGGEDSRLIVAQIHDLQLPHTLRVCGLPGDSDVECASRYAVGLRLPLAIQLLDPIVDTERVHDALQVSWANDGNGSWFNAVDRIGQLSNRPAPEYTSLHFSGVPGGEVHRGAYYLRAGLVSPSRGGRLRHELFTRLKFLLDVVPDLLKTGTDELYSSAFQSIDNALDDVAAFPQGTQVDHLLRLYQVTKLGTTAFPQRQPFYWPLGLRDITRAIYSVPPRYKQRSQLTRAATEVLFPELARMKTGNNIPTLRRTLRRWPLFVPGYYSTGTKIYLGAMRRLFRYRQGSNTLARRHRIDRHAPAMRMLLTDSAFSKWFRTPSHMATGEYYDGSVLNEMLRKAREGSCDHVEVLGRVINLEFASRFVSGETVDLRNASQAASNAIMLAPKAREKGAIRSFS